ncbi:radial spoke head protein 3 homolog [Chelonus insularis]|uniref:radial spoke head protein 3 homolog n=1 Tax=Chelonus insularis TaxID=460826 RepID=UPI00158E2939|nr:radial spoke head protein 3 homolog [Chelonus insularis]XP_034950530.1 radial spoke head protein 3 homolog [Chelonus insularis]
MPAGISSLPPSSFNYDYKNSPAFTIIQRDHHETSLPILHINHINEENDNNNVKNNKNLIQVKNEKNTLFSHKRISKSNDHLVLASLQNHQINPLKKKQYSKSHERLEDEKKSRGDSANKLPINLSTENFNQVLTAKLKDVQENEKKDPTKMYSKKKLSFQKKPFITTVKSGEFLMPPPEIAALLGMAPNGDWIGYDPEDVHEGIPRSKFRPLVSLNRRPEVRHNSHNARCPTALKATVDFAVNVVNSPAVTASTLANEERLRRTFCNKLTNHEIDHPLPFANIMFDRRVVRGSTLVTATNMAEYEQSHTARHIEMRRKQLAKKKLQSTRSMMMRMSSPPPVPGRKHEPVQTELYLEELLEKPQESEVGTQTDYFLDRPSTPTFCPSKTGVDAGTQIAPGDLFDFDVEVQPILEVLVGKTIEQAFIEVLEEEELAALREQQRRFRELRAAEKAEQLRLEEKERRLQKEKEQRDKQRREELLIHQETEDRVAAAVLLTGYVAEILPSVLEDLKLSGFLLDEIKSDVEEGFIPWLVQEVKKEVNTVVDSRQLLEEIIKEILEKRAEMYQKQGEDYHSSSNIQTDENDTEIEEIDGIKRKDSNFINYKSLIVDNSNSFQ